ncbi:MAG: hypothetical protein ACREYF_09075, partial [Gammaproteobacteria bacterium]
DQPGKLFHKILHASLLRFLPRNSPVQGSGARGSIKTVRGLVSRAIDPFAAPDPDGSAEREQEEHGKQHNRLGEVRREQSAGSGPRERQRKERHMTGAGDKRTRKLRAPLHRRRRVGAESCVRMNSSLLIIAISSEI